MRAFLAWAAETAQDSSVAAVARLVGSGDVDRIAASIGISAAALAGVVEAIRQAFIAGGEFALEELPRIRAVSAPDAPAGSRAPVLRIRFDVRNPRAEEWLRANSADLVTRILTEQREAIRNTLTAGAQAGRNPRAVALDIVGRLDSTGRRRGGIIGLTEVQSGYVNRARAQLASGDPEQMRDYLTRVRRDARFDGMVRRAIQAGRPVPSDQIDRIVGRYADRLLLLRGETVARTEALAAFNEARDETFRQAVEQADIPAEAFTKVWRSAADGRVREQHAAMNGQRVQFREPFRSPSGAMMMHPGDTSLGAGPSEIINCRCISQARIDHLRAVRRGR